MSAGPKPRGIASQAKSLKDAFVVARALVKKRELRERFEPSNPLMTGGENVRPLLIARP